MSALVAITLSFIIIGVLGTITTMAIIEIIKLLSDIECKIRNLLKQDDKDE